MNHLDLWVRKGLPGVRLPHILGSDIAGEVVETGEYVSGISVGQRVLMRQCIFAIIAKSASRACRINVTNSPFAANSVDAETVKLMAVPQACVIPHSRFAHV
jgi:NADPH:quinone reductase-like Zn-dependent oxidoreductase